MSNGSSPFSSPAKKPAVPRTLSSDSPDPLAIDGLSFKRRMAGGPAEGVDGADEAAGKVQQQRPGLLSNLLSSATIRPIRRAEPASEPIRRPGAPGKIAMPQGRYADEDDEEGGGSGTRTPRPGSPLDRSTPISETGGGRRLGRRARNDLMTPDRGTTYSPMRANGPGPMSPGGGPPPIPAALPPIHIPQEETPLPKLPLICLCFAMIAEFLSASVSGPFIFFFLVDLGVGQGPGGGGEADVGFWAGIVASVFFLSQFFTSLLWANAAGKHGRRAVLFVSLLGNGISLLIFGASTSLGMMICARLAQGVFNGAIGVARGAVRDITDPTNEARAITYMGLCWGMGGIVGPIIGGLLEHPVENHPWLFGNSDFLRENPYILPCMVAGGVTFVGAFLSLFLGWDGGLRSGAIQLPDEKPGSTANAADPGDASMVQDPDRSSLSGFRSRLGSRVSSYFGRNEISPRRGPINIGGGPSTERQSLALGRTPTRQSGVVGVGSAYGYQPRFPGGRRYTNRSQMRKVSMARSIARSVGGDTQYAPDFDGTEPVEPQPLNFAQRLLLANEDAVFGLHDVWLAAATTQDQEEYSQADPNEDWQENSVFEDDESGLDRDSGDEAGDRFGFDGSEPPSMEDIRSRAAAQAAGDSSLQVPGSRKDSPINRYRLGSRVDRMSMATGTGAPQFDRFDPRRPSISSARPAIFQNTGLATPPMLSPAISHAEQPFFEQGAGTMIAASGQAPGLAAIPETRPLSYTDEGRAEEQTPVVEKKPPSVFGMLPLAIIGHYAVLAFHGTTCDQVFMSFLVTEVKSGGLGLSASNYAELIAAMCVAQIIFQFQFYPKIGPPRGKLSHLAMFRLGLALYVPVYLLLPELRGLLREEHNRLVMFGMILLSAFRWLANVCAYTAVMVLVNAMTPPHLVPLANGLAQSAVSAARFVGPVFGGTVWSMSINPPNPRPYIGFYTIAAICFAGLASTTFTLPTSNKRS